MPKRNKVYQTLTVVQDGFHGQAAIHIKGRNWRAHNPGYLAVDLPKSTLRRLAQMDREYCTSRRLKLNSCRCGGIDWPIPFDVEEPNGAGVYLVPVEWVDESAPTEIVAAAMECEGMMELEEMRELEAYETQ